jgi:hypothetical protein
MAGSGRSPIPVDSELARIGVGVFESCWAVRSIILRSTVESVDEDCFSDCDLLSNRTFGSPSYLRDLLSLPTGLSRLLAIPDSVENLRFDNNYKNQPDLTLGLRPISRLSAVDLSNTKRSPLAQVVFQASIRSVKALRRNREFESD